MERQPNELGYKRRVDVKIVLVGNQGAGKSSLLQRYKEGGFIQDNEATIGAAFATSTRHSKDGLAIIKANIWDTAGMERFHSLIPMYIRDATCTFVCFDFPNIEDIERHINFVRITNENCSIILVQTKIDNAPTFNLDRNREISRELSKYATENGYKLFRTSAKSGVGVNEVFDENIEYSYVTFRKEAAVIKEDPVIPEHDIGYVSRGFRDRAALCCVLL